MTGSEFCYFNGDILTYEKLKLHVSDLLFQRGYGVFDYFRCRNGRFPFIQDYRDRLFRSIELAGLEPGLHPEEFSSLIFNLHEKNNLPNGAFKIIVSGGYSENLESVTGKANVIILNINWNSPPPETFTMGVNLISERFIRPNPEIKSLFYFNTLRLRNKMHEYQAADVMYFTDMITEASRANLFFVKGERIYTPAGNILKGVTRKQVLSLFKEIRVEDIDAESRYDFDEMFLTSTSRDITPVVSLDGKKIGKGTPGPVTREILNAFQKEAEGR